MADNYNISAWINSDGSSIELIHWDSLNGDDLHFSIKPDKKAYLVGYNEDKDEQVLSDEGIEIYDALMAIVRKCQSENEQWEADEAERIKRFQ